MKPVANISVTRIHSHPLFSTGIPVAFVAAANHSRPAAMEGISMLFAIVRRGKKSGIRLFPHRHPEDDRFRVSLTRQGPHIPLHDDRDIPDYLANGYSLMMSNSDENYRPTLIRPNSIHGWQ